MVAPFSLARSLLVRVYHSARSRAAATRMQGVQRSIAAGNALKDKVAIITGASSGIGLAMATVFARAGADCVLVAIDTQAGAAAVDSLVAQKLHAHLEIADVSDATQVEKLALEVRKRFGRVDVLINNAGVFLDEDRAMHAGAVDDSVVQRTLAVNLYGTLHVCSSFVPLMASGGRIINVSSVMGQLSRISDGYAPAYRLSKAALNSYTQSLAADLRPHRVMVDCVHPGWVRTAIGGPQAAIDPEEATDTAFFLATRPASPATGLFWWDCQTIRW